MAGEHIGPPDPTIALPPPTDGDTYLPGDQRHLPDYVLNQRIQAAHKARLAEISIPPEDRDDPFAPQRTQREFYAESTLFDADS
ncbi:MAG: hypothetical protein US51_C0002G0012 [Microgenomates group bacterium GW2011_GWA2_37_6]|nr:MAG: hypothetical protein US51_C0002G0012 [Microgenomates group bacterium GW2011_GWA2_37_6]